MTILGKKQMSEEDIKLNYITPVIDGYVWSYNRKTWYIGNSSNNKSSLLCLHPLRRNV